MTRSRKLLVLVAGATLIAACGGASTGGTTTSVASAPSTTTAPDSPSTTAPAVTSTAPSETNTTASAPEATGDLSLIQAAMAKSAESAPSLIEGVITMVGIDAGTGVPTDVEMPFSVTTDAATGNTAMVMDFGAMAGAMGGGEEVPAEMAEMMGTMEVRQIGDVVYLKFPFFGALLGAQTEWVSMPAEDGTDLTGGLGGGAAPSDPTSFLDSLSDAEGTVEDLGAEDVGGISTTRYRVVVDDSWRDKLTTEELADLEAQGPLPTTSFPMDLWVDDDGLVHRMSMEVSGSDMAATEPGQSFESMTMTFDFFDFGQSVTIEPPPAELVSDVSELSGPFGTMVP